MPRARKPAPPAGSATPSQKTRPYGVILSPADRADLERAAEILSAAPAPVGRTARIGPRTLAANLIREGVKKILAEHVDG